MSPERQDRARNRNRPWGFWFSLCCLTHSTEWVKATAQSDTGLICQICVSTGFSYELSLYISDFQPFSSHDSHKIITKILLHTKKYVFFANLTKNRYSFDSFTLDGFCCMAVVIFFYNLREKCPWLNSQVLQVLKLPVAHHCAAAHRLKLAALQPRYFLYFSVGIELLVENWIIHWGRGGGEHIR